MAATCLSRAAAKRRLRDILENALPGIAVSYDPPRTPAVGPAVTLGDIRGEVTVPDLRARRLATDDRFTIDVIASTWGPGDPDHEAVDAELEDIVEQIRSILAERPFLSDDGGNPLPGVVAVTLAEMDGPTPWWTAEGVGAAMRLGLSVHIRIT